MDKRGHRAFGVQYLSETPEMLSISKIAHYLYMEVLTAGSALSAHFLVKGRKAASNSLSGP